MIIPFLEFITRFDPTVFVAIFELSLKGVAQGVASIAGMAGRCR